MIRLKKIYGFLNGALPDGKFIVTAVTEDGEVIASVAVQDEAEGRAALGMNGESLSRHHLFERKYPEGASLEWVPFATTRNHNGLTRAIKAYYERKGQAV